MQEQQEKLARFEKAVFAEVDAKADNIRRDAETGQKEMFSEYEILQAAKSEKELNRQKEELKKNAKHELAKFSLDCKRKLLVKRAELTDEVFASVQNRLQEFRASEEYPSYLLGCISAFSKTAPSAELKIFVHSADLPLAKDIQKACSQPCTVEADDSIDLGGFTARAENSGVCYDETLRQKLAGQKNYFIENSGLSL